MEKQIQVKGKAVKATVTCTRIAIEIDGKTYERILKPSNMAFGRGTKLTWHMLAHLDTFPDNTLLLEIVRTLAPPPAKSPKTRTWESLN